MTTIKLCIYGLMVACFIAAGSLDAFDGHWKAAILAWMFGLCNAIIFFWR